MIRTPSYALLRNLLETPKGRLHSTHTTQHGRKAQGAFYTPVALVERVTQAAFDSWRGEGAPRVLDPACGTGAFLASAMRRGALGFGVDSDAEAVGLARLALPSSIIVNGDFVSPAYTTEMRFDIVLGNPPYVRYHALDRERVEALASRYESCTGQFDLFAPIIERALEMLEPGGVLAFVLPSLFLRGPRYTRLRSLILQRAHVVDVVEHGDGMFAGVQAPTCHVVLKAGLGKSKIHASEAGFLPISDLDRKWLNSVSAQEKLGERAKIRRGYPAGRKHPAWNTGRGVPCIAGEDMEAGKLRRVRTLDIDLAGWPEVMGRAGGNRVLVRETGANLIAVVPPPDVHITRTVYAVWPDDDIDPYALASLLNSEHGQRWYRLCCKANTGIFPKLRISQLRRFPLPDRLLDAG